MPLVIASIDRRSLAGLLLSIVWLTTLEQCSGQAEIGVVNHAAHPASPAVVNLRHQTATGDSPGNADSTATIVAPTGRFPALSPTATMDPAVESKPAAQFAVPGAAITVASSLAVVLGMFAGLIWLTRRWGGTRSSGGELSSEIVRCLGTKTIDARTQLNLIQCGRRVIVVARTAGGIQPLAEIADPQEVAELVSDCCGQAKLSRIQDRQPTDPVRTQPSASADQPRSVPPRRRLFATA